MRNVSDSETQVQDFSSLTFEQLKSTDLNNYVEAALEKATNDPLDLGGGHYFHNPLDFLLKHEESWRALADEFPTIGELYAAVGIFSEADFDPTKAEQGRVFLEKLSLGEEPALEREVAGASERRDKSFSLLGGCGSKLCDPSAGAAAEVANVENNAMPREHIGNLQPPQAVRQPSEDFPGVPAPVWDYDSDNDSNASTAPPSPTSGGPVNLPTPKSGN